MVWFFMTKTKEKAAYFNNRPERRWYHNSAIRREEAGVFFLPHAHQNNPLFQWLCFF